MPFVQSIRSGSRVACAFELDDLVDDLLDPERGLVSDERFDLAEVGYPAEHVLESRLVGLFVGDLLDFERGIDAVPDEPGEVADRDLAVVADIVDLAVGAGFPGQPDEGADDVANPAEAARLIAVA